MLNVVVMMGRLVADPVMRQTQTGKQVASFRLACDRGRKNENGNTVADFFDVVCWEHTAEFLCKYFQKGSLIAVDGRLQSRNYTDKNGNNRTAIEILANSLHFAGSKKDNPGGAAQPNTAAQAPAQTNYASGTPEDFQVLEEGMDDLPF